MEDIKKKMVTLKIESPILGHETKTMCIQEACQEIQTQVGEHGKWLYVDGKFQNVDTANADGMNELMASLNAAEQDITLAGKLRGG